MSTLGTTPPLGTFALIKHNITKHHLLETLDLPLPCLLTPSACDENHAMSMECLPPYSATCDNHNIQASKTPKHKIAHMGRKGTGLLHDDIDAPPDTFYGEYCGELINHDELLARQQGRAPDSPFYTL